MITLPKEPVSGEPLGISWARDVVRCLRSLRIISGPGLSADYGPNGTRLAAKTYTIPGTPANPARPWDLTFANASGTHTATFSNCVFKRDTFTLLGTTSGEDAGTVSYEMPSATAGTVLFLGFLYNSESGAVTIISDASFDNVRETAVPSTDIHIIKTPLYRVTFSTFWAWTVSYREAPALGQYN